MADEDMSAVPQDIRPIHRSAIHRISSGQGILNLAGAVKELVENSLDAGANRIDIRLKEYGADLIEVADNGPGISSRNYQALTLKYFTSKIVKFTDLQNLSSFGFRGEALSSLCTLSRVTISTKTADELLGTRLEYDLSGLLVTRAPIARCVGTTVAVSKLFFPLPVRENEFRRNIKREFRRLVTVLQAYALISKRIRLLCTNNAGKAGRTTVVQTLGSLSVRDNIVAVFGTKTIMCLEWIDLSISDQCRVEGFLSKPSAGNGRASRDRQFFFINGRPVDMPKAAKVLNQLYKSFNPLQFPMVIINFTLPNTAYDINVSPDKRKVFVHNEDDHMKGLIAALQKDYASVMDGTTTTAKKNRRKTPEPSSVQQAVPAEVPFNGNVSVTNEPEADGDDSCGGLGQDGDAEMEEAPIMSTSDFAEYGKHSFGDLRQDGGVEREEAPIISTSDLAGYGKHSGGGLGLDGVVEREKVPILSTSDSAEFGNKELRVPDEIPLQPFRPSLRLKSLKQNSRNAITAIDSLSAGLSSTSRSEVQPRNTVQSRLTELVSRCKRPQEESGERPLKDSGGGLRLQKCRLVNTISLDEKESKVEQIQSSNSKQGSLPRWFTGSEKPSEIDVHQGSMSSKLKPVLHKTRFRRNIQVGTAEVCDFSPESQADVPSDSPRVVSSQQLAEALAKVSSKNTECGERGTNELHDLETGKKKQKPLDTASEGLTQTSSVLRFNRLPAAEVKEAGGLPKDVSVLSFDMARLQMLSKLGWIRHGKKDRSMESSKRKSFRFAATSYDCVAITPAEQSAALEAAAKELEQKLDKADFKRMKVVGQFDLRFILVTLDEDIFIVDQHASDEIYNFENIMRTADLDSQPLSKSVPLELNAADQVILKTHVKSFRKNGFDFHRKRQRSGGHKLRLSSVPSGTIDMLGVEDVKELISFLANREGCKCDAGHLHPKCCCQSSSLLPRPSRVRAMFVSQACTASRMAGDALSKKEMEEVVSRLADLEAPWTCPHGRPTIRHIFDLYTCIHPTPLLR